MTFEPTAIQKFGVRDATDWLQVGDHQAYVGYIADEDEGSHLGLAYIRFRKGVEFDFLWAYDEVAVVTKGSLTVWYGDEVITVGVGESLYMPAGVRGRFDIREDMEAFCVHYPTDGKAGREWQGPELLPADAEIRPVSIDEVWD
ncbi:cupin domain-containing protein [Phytoactinopolyspora mesophila]|uniref:Cupin domain-containing protein n=1 Tax=Phytoactinopolyspora mesophila TaxID=2650750 RepID=A0A7K3M194_9ACTN|nr:cupin domain-containing protein [Phytoactinopolyspora mesophila]NDL56208.1 cupin domain-containing protein [Phytoactinopolyspora mesophila]